MRVELEGCAMWARALWRTGLVQRSGPTGQREACVAGADLGGISKTEDGKLQSLVGDRV